MASMKQESMSKGFWIKMPSDIDDDDVYYSSNKYLNTQTNMMMAYAHPNKTLTPNRDSKVVIKNKRNVQSQVWFGKKYKGGETGGLLKHKGMCFS